MSIIFDDKVKTITLQTKETTYQMKIDRQGVLLHTYYGEKTDDLDKSYMICYRDRGVRGILMKRAGLTGHILWIYFRRNTAVSGQGITGSVH